LVAIEELGRVDSGTGWGDKLRMIEASFKGPDVVEVGPSDALRAISTQVMAFGGDPIMRWIYPEAGHYLHCFPLFTRAFGGRSLEHATCYATADFGAVAMWLPPGVEVDGGGFATIMQETGLPEKQEELFEILERMGEAHIEEPHWYLAILGVEPAVQGQGVGSHLLRHCLEKIDRAGMPAYLESSNARNVPFYQRHGFDVMQEIQVGSAPPVTTMRRDAGGAPAARRLP
jgi:GNAT superfamily N-acetyltransferase